MKVETTFPGKLISFEGLDGSGKSTQIRILRRTLETGGYRVKVLREPGGEPLAESIRAFLLDPGNSTLEPLSELLLYEASRAQLVARVIKPALAAGEIVLMDRFYDSTTAYQGYGRGLSLELIHSLHKAIAQEVEPQLTFFLDIPPRSAYQRIKGKPDRMESAGPDFFQRVRRGYQELSRKLSRFVILDGEAPRDVNSRLIGKLVRELLDGEFPSPEKSY